MNILSTDTAFGNTSVCILSNGKVLAFQQQFERESQAEKLFPIIQECLNQANLTYNDIDVFSTNLGPGSFTGIRIGLSGVKAIAHSLNKIFYGVTAFEAMAWNFFTKPLCHSGEGVALSQNLKIDTNNSFNLLINANRNEVYLQKYSFDNSGNLTSNHEPELINLDEVENYSSHNSIFVCDNENILNKLKEKNLNIYNNIISITAQDIAQHINNLFENNITLTNRKSPVYIRKPDAKLPNKAIKLQKQN